MEMCVIAYFAHKYIHIFENIALKKKMFCAWVWALIC